MQTPLQSWRINERHYGNLQGLNKKETVAKFGAEQVHIWRRSYDIPPPLAGENYKNEINPDIKDYQNKNDFLGRIRTILRKNYKFFDEISKQLDYLKSQGLFGDLSPKQFQTYKQALNLLFNNKQLSNTEKDLLDQENEYLLVRGESLKSTLDRVIKWLRIEYILWQENSKILIVAHGNSLRAMVKLLEKISNDKITKLNIPTGSPIFYDLKGLKVEKKEYGESEEVLKERAKKVAEQTGKK